MLQFIKAKAEAFQKRRKRRDKNGLNLLGYLLTLAFGYIIEFLLCRSGPAKKRRDKNILSN